MQKTNTTKLPHGVYTIRKKDGSISYRASLTCHAKHISLGSFRSAGEAHRAYKEGRQILDDPALTLERLEESPHVLPFDKAVILINLRETGLYFGAPILLGKRDFLYYLGPGDAYRFDAEDLFYFASHRIMRRGGRLFVADYGSQIGVMTRFGIHRHAVAGRDYVFRNGDDHDLRYENIEIINRYHGVLRYKERGFFRYRAVIHVRGNFLIGRFDTDTEAAIAYNKAVDELTRHGIRKNYELNYIDEIGPADYAEIYSRIRLPEKLTALMNPLSPGSSPN